MKHTKPGAWITYLAAGGGACLALLIAYALIGIYPFGPLSIVHGDMYSQYLDFHAMAWRVLRAGADPLYSFSAGLGGSLIPMFAYYLASPLTLLIALFPLERLMDALLLITLLKVGCIALGYVYFARHFLSDRRLSSVLFAWCFALCGYVVAYASNIMWLDGLILLPVVLVGLRRLLREGRWVGLCLSLAVLFFVQFYIGYMVGIFTLLCFFVMAWADRTPHLGRRFLLFAGSALLAAGLCAVTLLPTALRLMENALDTSVNARNLQPFTLSLSQISLQLGKLLPGIFGGLYAGNGQIFCGLLCVLLFPAYLLNKTIPRRERVGVGVLALFLFICLFVPALTYFWQAFDHATAFPLRYSFLLSFLLIFMAHRCFQNIKTLPLPAVGAAAGALLLFSTLARPHWQYGKDGLPALILTLALVVVYCALVVLLRTRPHWRKGLLAICLAVVFVEVGANAYLDMRPDAQHTTGLSYIPRQQLLEEVSSRNSLLQETEDIAETELPYRVDEYTSERRNISFTLGNKRMQHFNSAASGKLGDAYKRLGYRFDGIIHSYEGHTIATESLLGLRYLFGESAQMIDQQPNDYYIQVARQGKMSLYENEYVFPLAFLADRGALSHSLLDSQDNGLETQNAAFAALGGPDTADLFQRMEVQPEPFNLEATALDSGYTRYVSPDKESGSYLDYRLQATLDAPVYLSVAFDKPTDKVGVYRGDYEVAEVDWVYGRQIVYIGQYFPGDEIRVLLYPRYGEMDLAFDGLYALDMEVLGDLSDRFYAAQLENVSWSDRQIRGTVNAQAGQILFLSVPYDGGWSARVDGRAVPVQPALGAFLGIDVPQGEHEIVLSYRPVGLLPGIVISLASLALFVLLLCLRRRKRRAAA